MVDSIKNSFSRVDPQQKGRASDVSNGPAKSAAGKASVAASSAETATSVQRSIVAEMAKAPPIDKKAVQKIKEAISRGDYPVDLERVSDALMDAYRELKD